jgi:hypothetical protein
MPMPTAATLANNCYLTGAAMDNFNPVLPAAGGHPTIYRNEHVLFNTNTERHQYFDQVNAMNANVFGIGPNPNAAGDMIYLPFRANHITSVRLTVPPPAGVTFFCTANLTGCRFFIDAVPAPSQDLVVYHANTTQHTAGANAWSDVQTPNAGQVLDQMVVNARADAPYAGLGLVQVAALDMHTYFLAAGQEERRKAHQGVFSVQGRGAPAAGAGAGRTRPYFAGCCFICAIYNGANWDFYYQAFGVIGYSRPGYVRGVLTFDWVGVHNRATLGATHNVGYGDFAVLDHQHFH